VLRYRGQSVEIVLADGSLSVSVEAGNGSVLDVAVGDALVAIRPGDVRRFTVAATSAVSTPGRDRGGGDGDPVVLTDAIGARKPRCPRRNRPETQNPRREGRGFVRDALGGAEGARTPDLLAASQTLSQLSYGPAEADCSLRRATAGQALAAASSLGTSLQRSSSR
jgi:hypothetical protein